MQELRFAGDAACGVSELWVLSGKKGSLTFNNQFLNFLISTNFKKEINRNILKFVEIYCYVESALIQTNRHAGPV